LFFTFLLFCFLFLFVLCGFVVFFMFVISTTYFISFQGFSDIMQGLVALNLFNEDESVDLPANGSLMTWVYTDYQ
jgi:hypothetical protein